MGTGDLFHFLFFLQHFFPFPLFLNVLHDFKPFLLSCSLLLCLCLRGFDIDEGLSRFGPDFQVMIKSFTRIIARYAIGVFVQTTYVISLARKPLLGG